jgi:hypothetical protein
MDASWMQVACLRPVTHCLSTSFLTIFQLLREKTRNRNGLPAPTLYHQGAHPPRPIYLFPF